MGVSERADWTNAVRSWEGGPMVDQWACLRGQTEPMRWDLEREGGPFLYFYISWSRIGIGSKRKLYDSSTISGSWRSGREGRLWKVTGWDKDWNDTLSFLLLTADVWQTHHHWRANQGQAGPPYLLSCSAVCCCTAWGPRAPADSRPPWPPWPPSQASASTWLSSAPASREEGSGGWKGGKASGCFLTELLTLRVRSGCLLETLQRRGAEGESENPTDTHTHTHTHTHNTPRNTPHANSTDPQHTNRTHPREDKR